MTNEAEQFKTSLYEVDTLITLLKQTNLIKETHATLLPQVCKTAKWHKCSKYQ